jgi:hypothetical protein
MSKLILGEWIDTKAGIYLDLARLIATRALLQAESGHGKSWALRKILEATHGHVQQIIVDVEGEFATLREKCDLIIAAAHDGDVIVHPKTARLLATRLLETQASAVLDLSELKSPDRHAVVRLLFESLIDAPKALRHPVLVVLDEAQLFAPEKGQGESEALDAVVDMASRGRKRGLALLAATQRIGKLHKSVAAELKNKLIGAAGLDVDVKRAAFDLGMTPKDALAALRVLKPGEFYAFGPAFHQVNPRVMRVGAIETTHPKVGHSQKVAPPKPSEAIKALLPKLADLPREAEEEARTIDDLKRELAGAKRELKLAQRAQPKAEPAPKVDAGAARRDAAAIKRLRGVIEDLMKFVVKINATGFAKDAGVDPADLRKAIDSAVGQAMKLVESKAGEREKAMQALQRDAGRLIAAAQKLLADDPVELTVDVKHQQPFAVTPAAARGSSSASRPARASSEPPAEGLTAPQQKLLDSLAWLESHGIHPARKETLAAIAGVSPTSGGYFNNLGALRNQMQMIDYPTPGEVAFTDAGRTAARLHDDGRAVHEHWLEIVTAPQRKILEKLVEAHPTPMSKDSLADQIGVSSTSGGYFNNLGYLRTIGALDYPQKGFVLLTKHVMP